MIKVFVFIRSDRVMLMWICSPLLRFLFIFVVLYSLIRKLSCFFLIYISVFFLTTSFSSFHKAYHLSFHKSLKRVEIFHRVWFILDGKDASDSPIKTLKQMCITIELFLLPIKLGSLYILIAKTHKKLKRRREGKLNYQHMFYAISFIFLAPLHFRFNFSAIRCIMVCILL